MILQPEKQEILDRIGKLYNEIKKQGRNWDFIFIADKMNQYYFTGTIQEGLFVLKNDGSYYYFVRRSFDRAKKECLLEENLHPMTSYKDVVNITGKNAGGIYIETENITYAMLERMGKYFDISDKSGIFSADRTIQKIRAVKSPYELSWMEESGRQHRILLEDIIPALLREGMSETELMAEMYNKMINLGYHGVTRFGKFQSETVIGQYGFGENSIYPTNFDGPGGMKGMNSAVPIIGDRNRLLKKGDLVFIDVGYGVNGYHSDRTQIYMFGMNPPDYALKAHKKCMEIQKETAALLKPGNIPGEIYNSVTSTLDAGFLSGFMGTGSDRVKFIGHGIGLQVDEYPVIANRFDEPLAENMTLAIEPKQSLENFGIVGVEDTYVVTKDGGRCITGGEKEIIVV
ncbi:MAG: Xaa-Pro peptidase family protein [Acidobacteriota bacterium]|jgi:Xaa-Pro aminopeptidase|nr:Xaa-Pro peptidase family protein [Acidobacteriota bacterium]